MFLRVINMSYKLKWPPWVVNFIWLALCAPFGIFVQMGCGRGENDKKTKFAVFARFDSFSLWSGSLVTFASLSWKWSDFQTPIDLQTIKSSVSYFALGCVFQATGSLQRCMVIWTLWTLCHNVALDKCGNSWWRQHVLTRCTYHNTLHVWARVLRLENASPVTHAKQRLIRSETAPVFPFQKDHLQQADFT